MNHPFRPLFVEVPREQSRRGLLDLTYLFELYYPHAVDHGAREGYTPEHQGKLMTDAP